MKGHVKKQLKGMLAMLLAVAMVVTCVPTTAFTSYAAEAQESIQETGADQSADEAVTDEKSAPETDGESGTIDEEPAADREADGDKPAAEDGSAAEEENQDGQPEEDGQKPDAGEEISDDQNGKTDETVADDGAADDGSDIEEKEHEKANEDTQEELTFETDEKDASNPNFPKTVVFAFNHDHIWIEDETPKDFTPWDMGGSLIGGEYENYMFIGGYEYRVEDEDGRIPFYFGIQTDLIPQDAEVSLSIAGNNWITGFDEPEMINSIEYVEGEEADRRVFYNYYRAALYVDGKLCDKTVYTDQFSLTVNGKTIGKPFTLEECALTIMYRVYEGSDWGTWKPYDNARLQLSEGDRIQFDYDFKYRLGSGLIGFLDGIDSNLLEVNSAIPAAATSALKNDYKLTYGGGDDPERPRYYIFTYTDGGKTNVNYPEFVVKDAGGVGHIEVSVFDKDRYIINKAWLEYTSLPVLNMKQEKTDGNLEDDVLKPWVNTSDEEEQRKNTNKLYVPKDQNVFKFYLCDKDGNPLTDGSYEVAPGEEEANEANRDYVCHFDASVNYWQDNYRELEKRCFTIEKDASNKIYLKVDLTDMKDYFPFPASRPFSLWFNVTILNSNKKSDSWQFMYSLYHAPEKSDLSVFGAGWRYDDRDENKAQWLEDRVYDMEADFDNGLYLNMNGVDYNETVPVYVKIPEANKASGVTVDIAGGNNWIKNAQTVPLWDFEAKERDENGCETDQTAKYSYYRIDLSLDENAGDEKKGIFTVTNGTNSQTYTLYEVYLQYSLQKSGEEWADKDEAWNNFEVRTIDMNAGDTIRFRIVGSGAGSNPCGAVRVLMTDPQEGQQDWLLGVMEDDGRWYAENNSLFVDPEISGDAREYLEGNGKDDDNLGRRYGEWGDYQVFYYPPKTGDRDKDPWNAWYPTFTMKAGKQGMNRMNICLWNRYGYGVFGDEIVVANRPDYGFKQDGADAGSDVLTNWFGIQDQRDPENDFDTLLKIQDYKLKFYLYDANGIVKDEDGTYTLSDGAEFSFRWRGLNYMGDYYTQRDPSDTRGNTMTLRTDSEKRVYLELDLNGIMEDYGYLGKTEEVLNPLEWYDLDLSCRVNKGKGESSLFWDFEYSLRHNEEAGDVQLFALGDWDDFSWLRPGENGEHDESWNAWYDANRDASWNDDGALDEKYLAGAWQYRLENGWCGKASYSGDIAAGATMLDQNVVPVYVRIPTAKAPATDQLFQIEDATWEDGTTSYYSQWIDVKTSLLGACDVDGTAYNYYRVELQNDGRVIQAYSEIPMKVTLNDGTSKKFTQKGMIVKYQIAKAAKGGKYDNKWIEYTDGASIVNVESGDRIRFDIDGSVTWSSILKGSLHDVSADMYNVTPISDSMKKILKDHVNREDYAELWDGRYHSCHIFRYDLEDGGDWDKTCYPEFTVKEGFKGAEYMNVDANDAFGDYRCSENIAFSTLPKLTLVQGDSQGNIIGEALIRPQDAPNRDEFRNSVIIPEDGIFRFYLCDMDGNPITLKDEAFKGVSFPDGDSDSEDNKFWNMMEWASMELYPYPWDGGRADLHFTWKNDEQKRCYLQIDISGKEKEKEGNRELCNNNWLNHDFWLPDGFDMWLHFGLYSVDAKGNRIDSMRWQFDYGLANEIALRQQGNEGKDFYESYEDVDSGRYNLSSGADNTLMPTEDGIFRFYFYERSWDNNENGDFEPSTGDVAPLGTTIPYVWFGFDNFKDGYIDVPLNNPEVSNPDNRVKIRRQPFDKRWYLEINLNDLTGTVTGDDGEEKTVEFDPYSDYYQLNIQFTRQIYNEGKAETDDARNYRFSYSPVTVLGWNATENLSQELAADMTEDNLGRVTPYSKGYADASTVYRRDDSVVLYVRIPRRFKPEPADVAKMIGLEPTDSNEWVKSKEDNWFKEPVVSVQELDFDTMYHVDAEWAAYPVDDEYYEYYQVRLKGGARNTMTLGALTVTLYKDPQNKKDDEKMTFDFTLEQAMAQYSADGTKWTDVKNEYETTDAAMVTLAPGASGKLRLTTGGGLPDTGVIAMVRDDDNWDGSFRLSADDMPEAARTAWKKYQKEYGYGPYFGTFYTTPDSDVEADIPEGVEPEIEYNNGADTWENFRLKYVYVYGGKTHAVWYESSYTDWGEYYIFTYEDAGVTKTYYPRIISSDSEVGNKYMSLYAVRLETWDEGGKPHYEVLRDWACQVHFDKASYTFRYEKDLTHDISSSDVPIDLTKDTMKFYVYKDGAPYSTSERVGRYYDDWWQLACWFADYSVSWDLDDGSDVKIGTDATGIYVELKTATLKKQADKLNYDFANEQYTFGMRVPICIGNDGGWFLVEDSQSYCPADKIGVKLITGIKTDEDQSDHEVYKAVPNGGKETISLSQEMVEMNLMYVDLNGIDLDTDTPVAVSSSNKSVVEVVQGITYAGEDKWRNSLFENAELKLKKAGTVTITVSFNMRDGEEGEKEKKISFELEVTRGQGQISLKSDAITVENIEPRYKYTGEPVIVKDLVVKESGKTEPLKLDEDYTLFYENNVEVGTATLTITGIGNYKDSIAKRFRIVTTYRVSFNTDGGRPVPGVQVVMDGEYANKPAGIPVKGDLVFGGWFTNEYFNTEFDFDSMEITKDTVVYAKWLEKGVFYVEPLEPQMYTGKALKPVVRVYDGEKLLTEKTDYTVRYSNNTAANWKEKDEEGNWNWKDPNNIPTVTITGKGNYSDSPAPIEFEIKPIDITGEDITASLPWEAYKNGNEITPKLTLKWGKKALKKDKDYSFRVLDPDDPDDPEKAVTPKAVGVYDVEVRGEGNYDGVLYLQFGIVGDGMKLASKLKVSSIKKRDYTGEPITPEVIVKDGKKTLVENRDYTVSYKNNVKPGKGTAVITGKGKYAGSKEVNFTIIGESIAKAKITGLDKIKKVYSGRSQVLSDKEVELVYDGISLAKGEDYSVSYVKNLNAGTATVVYTGINGYSGSLKKTFKIAKYNIEESDVEEADKLIKILMDPSCPYRKGGSTPAVTVTFNGKALVAGRDYSISYANNKKPTVEGTAEKDLPTVTITGKGNFEKKISKTFTITKQQLASDDIRMVVPDTKLIEEKGKYISKPVLYDANGKKLAAGTDYDKATIVYTLDDGTVLDNNSKVEGTDRTVTVTVTGMGYYEGDKTATYRLTEEEFNPKSITIKDKWVTGEAVTLEPEDITVMQNSDTKLEYGTDYKILEGSYLNNVKKGNASVIIVGQGKYGGMKTVKFKITAKAIKEKEQEE